VSVRILDPDSNNLEVKNADCEFGYRTSRFKQRRGGEVILEAIFRLERDSIEACIARMNQYTEHRRRTQPTEPSIGSMFKNPPNDYAGRLIDAAGLKGTRSGQIGVSTVHGNFFVNHGGATSADVLSLIELVRGHVKEKFKVELELEIEIIGSGE
jgi:UDP-N-acetylmuramate dehydrogenase